MSSHDMSVRTHTHLVVCPGTTMGQVASALDPFFKAHRLEFHADCNGFHDQVSGELVFVQFESGVTLTNHGELRFYLNCTGNGHGIAPEAFDQMCAALTGLLNVGGVVEYIDHDISAANASAVTGVFVQDRNQQVDNVNLERDLAYVRALLSKSLSTTALAQVDMHIRLTASMACFRP